MKAEAFASAHKPMSVDYVVGRYAAMKAEAFASAHLPQASTNRPNEDRAAMKAEAFASAHPPIHEQRSSHEKPQ